MTASGKKTTLIQKSKGLRRQGYSLNRIASEVGIPRSTIYWHIKNIALTPEQKDKIKKRRIDLCARHPNPRKGKCAAGRLVLKPERWSEDLVHVLSHILFDGGIEKYGCAYYSSNISQIHHVEDLFKKVFGVTARIRKRNNGVFVLLASYIELADYARQKEKVLLEHIVNGASRQEKRIFLQSFFDDEGSIYFNSDKRRVRGSQDSFPILKTAKKLLWEFGIKARIDERAKAVEVSRRQNIEIFKKEINFSEGIFVNKDRKNTIWGKKIEKREILTKAIGSYFNA